MFEYMVEAIADEGFAEGRGLTGHLNDFGRDNWELVAATQSTDGSVRLFFKRRRLQAV